MSEAELTIYKRIKLLLHQFLSLTEDDISLNSVAKESLEVILDPSYSLTIPHIQIHGQIPGAFSLYNIVYHLPLFSIPTPTAFLYPFIFPGL